jgi:hypothetical protein
MQGLAVVPLFAGYDTTRGRRPAVPVRRHRRPLRGARLRRHRLGQPARRHRRQARLPRRSDRDDAVDLAISALFQAADEDSATGGPDLVRGIYPTVATITAAGFDPSRRTTRSPTASGPHRPISTRWPAPRAHAIEGAPHEHAVLRRPEQVMKDRADYARKGIARGRSLVALVYDEGIVICAENPSNTCARSARSTTASPSPAWASTTSSTSCASPASATPTSRATPTAARTSTPAAWPTSTPRSSARSSPTR